MAIWGTRTHKCYVLLMFHTWSTLRNIVLQGNPPKKTTERKQQPCIPVLQRCQEGIHKQRRLASLTTSNRVSLFFPTEAVGEWLFQACGIAFWRMLIFTNTSCKSVYMAFDVHTPKTQTSEVVPSKQPPLVPRPTSGEHGT